MSRIGGDKTKNKILSIAETLFAEKGYDGTSMQEVADTASVNKALIYYHFKNKQDIIDSLFERTLNEMFELMQHSNRLLKGDSNHNETEKISEMVEFLEKKKKIISVMLMEALKNEKDGHISLFRCAEMIIKRNANDEFHGTASKYKSDSNKDLLLMHEFFTGFVPIAFFAIFKDKWAKYFNANQKGMTKMFSEVFVKSHIQHK